MPYVSKPMKLVTVWFTEEEKAFLDELAKNEDITLSKAIREGLQLYFEDAKDWIEERRDEGGATKPPERFISADEVADRLGMSR